MDRIFVSITFCEFRQLLACVAWQFRQFFEQFELEHIKRVLSRENELSCLSYLSPKLLVTLALVIAAPRFPSALKLLKNRQAMQAM